MRERETIRRLAREVEEREHAERIARADERIDALKARDEIERARSILSALVPTGTIDHDSRTSGEIDRALEILDGEWFRLSAIDQGGDEDEQRCAARRVRSADRAAS